MNCAALSLLMILFSLFPVDGVADRLAGCLPEGVGLEEIVSPSVDKTGSSVNKKVTVRDTLHRLNARCKKGKLIDGKGKEIYFFRLIGCWGNPPEDYQQQLAKQQEALERLRKKYTVIEISCDQTGDLRTIS
ncbi:MAG TPA: hypothetical protein VIV66_09905 [Pyrinomonadaceae bacterium]